MPEKKFFLFCFFLGKRSQIPNGFHYSHSLISLMEFFLEVFSGEVVEYSEVPDFFENNELKRSVSVS